MTAFYFYVEDLESGFCATWIGGGLKKSKRPGYVWLTKPGGEPILEIKREYVHPSTREETARRLREDARARKAPLN